MKDVMRVVPDFNQKAVDERESPRQLNKLAAEVKNLSKEVSNLRHFFRLDSSRNALCSFMMG
jgi:hypothetical protein